MTSQSLAMAYHGIPLEQELTGALLDLVGDGRIVIQALTNLTELLAVSWRRQRH